MKRILLLAMMFVFVTAAAFAEESKTYRVSGPLLEVTDTMIVVKRGKGKWEMKRNENTKVASDLKVGSKVTIKYTMTAVNVEAKKESKKKTTKP